MHKILFFIATLFLSPLCMASSEIIQCNTLSIIDDGIQIIVHDNATELSFYKMTWTFFSHPLTNSYGKMTFFDQEHHNHMTVIQRSIKPQIPINLKSSHQKSALITYSTSVYLNERSITCPGTTLIDWDTIMHHYPCNYLDKENALFCPKNESPLFFIPPFKKEKQFNAYLLSLPKPEKKQDPIFNDNKNKALFYNATQESGDYLF